jgi:hypothetical protein
VGRSADGQETLEIGTDVNGKDALSGDLDGALGEEWVGPKGTSLAVRA